MSAAPDLTPAPFPLRSHRLRPVRGFAYRQPRHTLPQRRHRFGYRPLPVEYGGSGHQYAGAGRY